MINGLTLTFIFSLVNFIKQIKNEKLRTNLNVGIYLAGYLALLLFVTFVLYRDLHAYLLSALRKSEEEKNKVEEVDKPSEQSQMTLT
jgi:hypothetical protein